MGHSTLAASLTTILNDDQVEGASWSSEGSHILTWHASGTVKLWDTAGGLLTTISNGDRVVGARWSSDGSRILTWSWVGTAKIHYTNTADLIELACRAAGRSFSLDEWRRYMDDLPYRRTCDRLPLHLSYRLDIAARLESGALSEAAAVAEVARALQVDPYATGEPPAELVEESRRIIAELRKERTPSTP